MSRKIEGLVAAAKAEEKDFDPQKAREGLGEIVDDLASYERVIGLSKVRRTTEELRTMSAPLWKVQKVQAPIWEWFKTDWTRYGWIAVGFVLMAVFMLLRLRIFWWPHPIGYVCYTNVHAMMKLWFSIFIGWLLKLCIIKYGGFRIYYKLRDLFIGLIVGEMMTGGIWILIKALAGVQGGWKIDIN